MTKQDFATNFYDDTNTILRLLGSTVFGIPASQTWNDLMLWEHFLNYAKPSHVVELGTGRGGMSLFLALQCISRGATFATVDTQNWTTIAGPLYALAQVAYTQGDIFESGKALVEEAMRLGGPVAVFCDGGDKPKEMREFAPMLRPGDYIVVHDWGYEIKQADIEGLPVTMLDETICKRNDSVTRWFLVARND